MNKVKCGDCTDAINILLYLAVGHMAKECKVTENNGACWSLYVLFIDGRYLARLIRFKNKCEIKKKVFPVNDFQTKRNST